MAIDYDVSNHPDNAELHSLPKDSPPDGTVKMAGTVLDRSNQFSDLKTLNTMIHNLSEATGVKRPGMPDTPATVIKLPPIKK